MEYDKTAKSGKVIKEKQGNQLDQDKFYSYVEKSIQQLKTRVNLDKANVYLKPKYVQTDKEVLNELSQYNNYLCRWVRFDMGEKHYETISLKKLKIG